MQYRSIDSIKDGDVIAGHVYNSRGVLLAKSGTVVSDRVVCRLKNNGVETVKTFGEVGEWKNTISEQMRERAISSLKRMDVRDVSAMADEIVFDLKRSGEVAVGLGIIRDKTEETYVHSLQTAVLSATLGIGLGWSDKELSDLAEGALLHDAGKLYVPEDILDKKGKLEEWEREMIKMHPQRGYNFLREYSEIPAVVRTVALMHHENWDGSGYPFGKKEKEVHRYARVVHVADVFEALTSVRPYKKAYSPAEALEYLMGNSGTMFDPEIVKVFAMYVQIFPVGGGVMLSDGRHAVVTEPARMNPLRPTVTLTDTDEILNLEDDPHTYCITILGPDIGLTEAPDENSLRSHIQVPDGERKTEEEIRREISEEGDAMREERKRAAREKEEKENRMRTV